MYPVFILFFRLLPFTFSYLNFVLEKKLYFYYHLKHFLITGWSRASTCLLIYFLACPLPPSYVFCLSLHTYIWKIIHQYARAQSLTLNFSKIENDSPHRARGKDRQRGLWLAQGAPHKEATQAGEDFSPQGCKLMRESWEMGIVEMSCCNWNSREREREKEKYNYYRIKCYVSGEVLSFFLSFCTGDVWCPRLKRFWAQTNA